MILADKILNLRKRNGWSQEELARQLGVSRQSISKWEGAQAIPDINRILDMSKIFGVSTDVLMKDELELDHDDPHHEAALAPHVTTEPPRRHVSLEEATEFLRLKYRSAKPIAFSVLLFILSPVTLLVLMGFVEGERTTMSQNAATAFGMIALFVLIVIGVSSLVYFNHGLNKFEYLEKELIETEYGVAGMVEKRKEQFHSTYLRNLISGIAIVTVAPLITMVVSLLHEEDDFLIMMAASAMLVMLSIGTYLIVSVLIVNGAHQQLLQEEDYSPEGKRKGKILGPLSAIFWIATVVIFLATGFVSNSWDGNWIIWPIAGLLYAITMIAANMVLANKAQR